MLPESAPHTLAAYRFEKASSLLKDALLLYDAGQWASANNRTYYSLFHAMRAVLALEQKDFKKHSAVIAEFNREFIHSGAFDHEFLTIINHASIIRNHSDYDDFYLCSSEETNELIADARRFLDAVSAYLIKQGCTI